MKIRIIVGAISRYLIVFVLTISVNDSRVRYKYNLLCIDNDAQRIFQKRGLLTTALHTCM